MQFKRIKGSGCCFFGRSDVRFTWWLVLELTGAQGGGRDLDLTGCLVGLEGRGSTSGTDVGGKQVGALSPRGAGAGSITPVVRLLLIIHSNQLEGGQRTRGRNTSAELPMAGVVDGGSSSEEQITCIEKDPFCAEG